MGDIPLRLQYPKLYECCSNKTIRVSDCWVEGEWRIHFRRSFGHFEVKQWEHLIQTLCQISISDNQDRVKWALEKKGMYTTCSMYRMLTNR